MDNKAVNGNMPKINVTPSFSVPIYDMDLEDFARHQDALVSQILAMREAEAGDKVSNQDGWHSAHNLHQSDNSEIQWLIGQIAQVGRACIRHSKTAAPKTLMGLASCWANVNESGDWNAPHAHFPADWSGVCYVRVNRKSAEDVRSDKDGDVLFMDPLPLGPQYRRPPTMAKRPVDGKIFVFPSCLVHMVAPHFEKDPRISVAFNFRLTGAAQ